MRLEKPITVHPIYQGGGDGVILLARTITRKLSSLSKSLSSPWRCAS